MKNHFYWSFLAVILILAGGITWFNRQDTPTELPVATTIQWLSLEEALAANQKNQKKFLVDVYTDWCGWCKVMDKKTFTDPVVIQYVNTHFHPVKFNAEQKTPIQFNGKEYTYVNTGRRGVNTLAYQLLDGRLGYPSIVYLDGNLQKIRNSPGFKDAQTLMTELTFAAEEHYRQSSFENYNRPD